MIASSYSVKSIVKVEKKNYKLPKWQNLNKINKF